MLPTNIIILQFSVNYEFGLIVKLIIYLTPLRVHLHFACRILNIVIVIFDAELYYCSQRQ